MLPLHAAAMGVFGDKAMSHLWLAAQVFVAGALFHVLCELTGLNRWYCRDRVDRAADGPWVEQNPRIVIYQNSKKFRADQPVVVTQKGTSSITSENANACVFV